MRRTGNRPGYKLATTTITMDEQKLVISFALFLLVICLILFFFPFFAVLIPIVIAIIYHVNQLQRADGATATSFFNGWIFGGHRGSPYSFPENSMSGFAQAQKEGADLIEFDLAMSKDGIAVIMHDDTLDRTTDLSGPVKDKTLGELRAANLAAKFARHNSSPVSGSVPREGVPTLEEVIQFAVKNNIRMLFDVKDYSDEMVGIIVKAFEDYQLYNKAIVCSFYPWVIYKVKRASGGILTGLTWRQHFFAFSDLDAQVPRYFGLSHYAAQFVDAVYLFMLKTWLPTFLGADMLLTNEKDICPAYVNAMREKGMRVAVWTVNDIVQAQWMMGSLQIPILTDFPYLSKQLGNLDKFVKNGFK
ncbi:hypothetical protein PRIPAC_96286 [Pristionchus pacificus]|uniref:GP-PDE domain-containing protein n=1 Tax=Pristionchus pacificus TaxID=54126 RepID=A0A2A6BCK9_PRIPA|nr:hypothetical protein PRIPAC_96286 [Pristionchus pacificus]|eukprot:PDM63586.1 hypothetical protein PRIPAC_49559 [Pristionchus pacificus]